MRPTKGSRHSNQRDPGLSETIRPFLGQTRKGPLFTGVGMAVYAPFRSLYFLNAFRSVPCSDPHHATIPQFVGQSRKC